MSCIFVEMNIYCELNIEADYTVELPYICRLSLTYAGFQDNILGDHAYGTYTNCFNQC